MTEVTIRKATLEDVPEITELAKQLWAFHEQFPTEFLKLRENASELFSNWCKERIQTDIGFVLVAEADNELAGYLLAFENKASPVYKDYIGGHIFDLYVKEKFRKQNLGKKLILEADKILKQKFSYCRLEASYENKDSIEFYKSMGFKVDRVKMVKKYD